MTIERRVAITDAALRDMGRVDLAEMLVPADEITHRYPDSDMQAVSWRGPRLDPEDEILLRRAAGLASIACGYDEQNVFCEACIRVMKDPGCRKVTRRQFLAHQLCELHAGGAA